jgi:hypothetical protein
MFRQAGDEKSSYRKSASESRKVRKEVPNLNLGQDKLKTNDQRRFLAEDIAVS